jgi:hypothetical protein
MNNFIFILVTCACAHNSTSTRSSPKSHNNVYLDLTIMLIFLLWAALAYWKVTLNIIISICKLPLTFCKYIKTKLMCSTTETSNISTVV